MEILKGMILETEGDKKSLLLIALAVVFLVLIFITSYIPKYKQKQIPVKRAQYKNKIGDDFVMLIQYAVNKEGNLLVVGTIDSCDGISVGDLVNVVDEKMNVVASDVEISQILKNNGEEDDFAEQGEDAALTLETNGKIKVGMLLIK